MGVIAAVLFLLAFVLLWALLPYLAGLREVWQQTDVAPLHLSRESEVEIRQFARHFRSLLTAEVARDMARAARDGETVTGQFADGEPYVAVGGRRAAACEPPVDDEGICGTVILSADPLVLPPDSVHVCEVYGKETIRAGARSVLRSVLAERDLRLERESVVLRWAHAAGRLDAATGTVLHGRASANAAIRLEEGCRFERLNAPLVAFGVTVPAPDPEPSPVRPAESARTLQPRDLPNRVEVTAGRWLVRGKLKLPAWTIVDADVVVTGSAMLGDGCLITGSIKARKDLSFGREARCSGSAISGRDLRIGRDTQVKGPVIAERDLVLAEGSVVGSPQVATTVSAQRIFCRTGARCHGTVWAHRYGELPLPAPDAALDPAAVADHAIKETVP